uniref:Nucleotide-diphospho-sugar transferase domain-containing protein n=1 Tax=Strongyloides stercoralis TaxID=6248 RepID=A0A0K0EJ36_STRER
MYKYILQFIFKLLFYLIVIIFFLQNSLGSNENCYMNGVEYNLQYTLPSNESIKGKAFSCKLLPYLKEFKLLDKNDFVDLTKESVPHPKVVTGFSDNHLKEAALLLKSFKKYFPKDKIIVYDLGLSLKNVKKLKKFCFVEYRKFNFLKYPKHVSIIKTYAFKILIAAEVLKEYNAIFWADASVRFKKSNLSYVYDLLNCNYGRKSNHRIDEQKKLGNGYRENIYKNIHRFEKCPECYWHFNYNGFDEKLYNFNVDHCYKFSILFHVPTFHGILPTIHKDVFKYFPTDKERYTNRSISRQYDAAFSLMIKTEDAVENVLKWAVLCALDKDCIQPIEWYSCGGHFTKENIFSNKHICYRFDQSILSLLLHNANNYDTRNYVSEIYDFVFLGRKNKIGLDKIKSSCKKKRF